MKQQITKYYQRFRSLSTFKKMLFWIGGAFALIVLLGFIADIILQRQFPNRVKNFVSERSKEVYEVNFANMEVNILRGNIDISGLEIIPSTTAYFRLDSTEQNSSLFKLAVEHVAVSGVSIFKWIVSGTPDIDCIVLQHPEIEWIEMNDKKMNKTKNEHEKISEMLQGWAIGRIDINQLSFRKTNLLDSSKNSGHLKGVSFQIIDLLLDSNRAENTSRLWFAHDIRMDSENLAYHSADGLYEFRIKSIKGSIQSKALTLDSFCVVPQYPEVAFSQLLGKQGDRYDMVFDHILASDINFKQLEMENRLHLPSLLLSGSSLKVFRNKSVNEVKIDKTLNFPHIALKTLGLSVTSDTILLKKAEVFYKELNPKSGKSGTVFFTDLQGTLLNVSNDSAQLNRDVWCRSSFTANFLGKSQLDLELNLNLKDKAASFNYRGSLGSASASLYNQLLEPMALARVDSGVIEKTTFDVQANRYGSKATVTMLYSGLKVSVMKKATEEKVTANKATGKTALGKVIANIFGSKDEEQSSVASLEKRSTVSLLANAVIKSDNPSAGEAPRTATVTYQHPSDKSFFNLMWKSIFTGLKDNLGIPL